MSISLLSTAASALKSAEGWEKDAQQKSAEANAEKGFASLLGQTMATNMGATNMGATNMGATDMGATDTTLVSGRTEKAVIPAVLIDAQMASTASEGDAAGATGAALTETTEQPHDPTQEFLDFASKTPAQKMRAMVLAEMGLTEEQLQALDPDARAEIEEKIRIRIEAKVRQGIEEQSGVKVGSNLTPALFS